MQSISVIILSELQFLNRQKSLNALHMKRVFTLLFLFLCTLKVYGQEMTVAGTVTDAETGEALIGASILEKGTSNGTVADIDGNYQLALTGDEPTLVISYIGYETQEIPVNNRTNVSVSLSLDLEELEEVVVVGYGSLKEKDLTSAITTIKTEEITKTPTSQAMQALQGKVAGVQIVSNGAPGDGPTVRVRGIGSFEGNAAPLYVVDGMFFENINFLNPNDIENISVLKDASASAIYGVRAANGVVLITTKGGSYNQKPQLTYDGYYGIQNPQNVLEMANTEQFVQYVNETGAADDISYVDNSFQRYGRSRANPSLPNVDTDWYDVILSPAPIQNHSLTFSGGGNSTSYSISGGYFDQAGLLHENTRDGFKRFNLRSKFDAKVRDWLKVGTNFNATISRQYVGEHGAYFNAYFAVPTFPAYDPANTGATPDQFGNAQSLGYRSRQNPLFPLAYNDNRNDAARVNGNVNLEIDFIPNILTLTSQYNYGITARNERQLDFAYNDGFEEVQSGIRKQAVLAFDQVWDNYLTYTNGFGNHNVTVVGGQSFRTEYGELLYIKGTELSPDPTFDQEHLWYLDRALNFDLNDIGDVNTAADGTITNRLYYLSFFGRLAYDFDGRYLLYGTIRVDGNNKYVQTWAQYPTVGAGWVLSEESFFDISAINFFKLRAGWGRLGNDNIAPVVGSPTLDPGRETVINGGLVQGRFLNPAYDLIDRPEFAEEINIGLSARALSSRMSLEADYFIRQHKDLAASVILPGFRDPVRRNVGAIENRGLEVSLSWTDAISNKLSYTIGGNIATLDNRVENLGGAESLNSGSAEFRQISIIGEPYQSFYGYEVSGVFQNAEEIASSGYSSTVQATLVPGDFFFKDQNGDGEITDLDRVILGSYIPSLTYGGNIGVTYGNLDLSANIQGQSGFSILNRKRGEIIFTNDANIDADLATNLWRGEGTSNEYPSAAGLRKGWNQNMSDYFVEDGSYFRVQNVRVSYNFKDIITNLPETRLTLTAERPLTVFQYNGFNPEVANGIDRQVYPIPAVYTVGLNIKL